MPPREPAHDLACPGCQGTTFVALVAIRHLVGSGTIYVPKGYQCLTCQQPVDVADLLGHELVKRIEKELVEKREQLELTKQRRRPSVSASTK